MSITTSWIDITPGFAGYLALPPAGSGPALVLFQEIFGVNEHIRAVAEQYALDGFLVLAPDAFWRPVAFLAQHLHGA
jgi:carboxymethylenebutenolidase